MSKIFDNYLTNTENGFDYEKKGIDLKDNTAKQIDLATQEMLEKIKKSWKDDNEIKKLKFDIAVKVINGGALLREIEYDGRHMLPAHLANLINLKNKDKFY